MDKETKLRLYDVLNYIRHYEGSYTTFREIRSWVESFDVLNRCITVNQLKGCMKGLDEFTERDFWKVDHAVDIFLKER